MALHCDFLTLVSGLLIFTEPKATCKESRANGCLSMAKKCLYTRMLLWYSQERGADNELTTISLHVRSNAVVQKVQGGHFLLSQFLLQLHTPL